MPYRNPADHREEKAARNAAYYATHREDRRAKQRWFTGNLNILKRAQGCTDCATHEGRLDHHHLDPATKLCNVAHMWNHSLEKFLDEIAKCTVLCRSCHKKREAV